MPGWTPINGYVANGWTIYFHRVFADRYTDILKRVALLKRMLPPEAYRQHAEVKLLARVTRIIREIVPANPDLPEYRLRNEFAKFRRIKGSGLPDRYRLFWVFSSKAKIIIFLYLNDDATLRQAGSRSDPYAIFKQLISRGEIGIDFTVNWQMVQDDEGEG